MLGVGVGTSPVFGGSVGGAWSPLTFALAFYLDFSVAASVTLNGSNVSQVNDLSGNGNHFTQGTAVNQPAYTNAGLNGLNVATFDGTNDYLTNAGIDLSSSPAATIWIVVKSGSGAGESILMHSPSASLSAGGFHLYGASGKPDLYTVGAGVTNPVQFNSTDPITSAKAVIGTIDRTLSTNENMVYVNGTANGSCSPNNNSTGNMGNLAMFLGYAATGSPLNGFVGEIGVAKTALTAPDIALLTTYLRNKWGV